jgi:hypothetical protein
MGRTECPNLKWITSELRVGCTQLICESEIALFPECMQSCAQKVVDTAGIVREAIFRQLATERTPQTAADDDGLVRLI